MKYIEIIIGGFLIISTIFFIFVCEITKKQNDIVLNLLLEESMKDVDAELIITVELDANTITADTICISEETKRFLLRTMKNEK